MRCPLFVVLILTTATVVFGSVNLKDVYDWKYIDFLWESKEQKEIAINSSQYIPSSCVPYDVDRAEDGRTFVTLVRDEGVPASLTTVSNERGPGGPLLVPYPNWAWNSERDCNGIINVYRVSIKCNYLFVLDCGKIEDDAVCPPKLLIFDLRNDMLVQRITIPSDIANNENGTGLLVTPLAYVRDCKHIDDVTVFMADIEGYGLAIYNEKSGFCRLESTFMKPTNPNFIIDNQDFYLLDGILGLAIVYKKLLYSPLSGNAIYKMPMYNKRKCSKLNESEVDKLTQLAGTLSGQTGPIASEQCAIFFSNIPETSILCKDATKEFESNNTELIAQDSERLQFASGMKVVNYGRTLTVLTNSLQRVITNTTNLNTTNFRILAMNMEQIRKQTNCFDSCSNDYSKPWHHKPWHHRHRHGNPWHHGPYFDKHDKYNKYDKHNKFDEYDKYDQYDDDDKHDKSDEDDKPDEHDKHGKFDEYDIRNRYDEPDKYDKDDKDSKKYF